MHNLYVPGGATSEGVMGNEGMQWPAILRNSGHTRAEGFWIGVKDWRSPEGQDFEYNVFLNGPRTAAETHVTLDFKLVSRWPATEVTVNGDDAVSRVQLIDEVDPDLPSDRMIYSRIRTPLGIDVERKVYAYQNDYHDDYHLVDRTFQNTGNTDDDEVIELPGQIINDAYFFNIWRWAGRKQAAEHGSLAQAWGKLNMIDIVGDGNEEYPVDFTAIYSWAGYDPNFSENWDNLGSPMLVQNQSSAPSDTIGRLAGMSMQGLVVLHADTSPSDQSYNALVQPRTLGWIDVDEALTAAGQPLRDYYELGILTRENPDVVAGGASRMYPHYANRIEPTGTFWAPEQDASTGKQGGHGATIAYGPYTMNPGEQVHIVEALGIGGLSYDAATNIGVQFKQNGLDENVLIDYDANGDGSISSVSFDYSTVNTGAEQLTKNQWFLTSRDSLYKNLARSRKVWEASSGMTQHPFANVPAPPQRFDVLSAPTELFLAWTTHSGEPDPASWEIYRTEEYVDNLPYERVAVLPGSARSTEDTDVIRGVKYYYYLVAVGSPTSPDPDAITGTPSGAPSKSSRFYSQTHLPVEMGLTPATPGGASLLQNAPNPFSDFTSLFYSVNGPTVVEIDVYNTLGQKVASLLRTFRASDFTSEITWDGRDYAGLPVSSGIYYCQIKTNSTTEVIPMLLLR